MNKRIKIAIGLLLLFLVVVFCFIKPKYNSKYKLNIINSYKNDEAYHPKVLSFENKWNGYKYWMSYTPYPKGDDLMENPHIVVSNDLLTWQKLYKVDRALDTPTISIAKSNYNSDSHIVYNDSKDELELYWRYVDNVNKDVYIYRIKTKDGKEWTKKEVAAYSKLRRKKDYVSPAIIYDKGTYKMWYVDHDLKVYYTTSKDGKTWSEDKFVDIKYNDKVKSWHLDVIKTDIGYEMIIVAFEDESKRNDMDLYYTKSKDGIKWDTAKTILKPTRGTMLWDNRGIYRSSFIKENGVYLVYYGGTNSDLHHGIGLVYGKDIFNLKSTNVDFDNESDCEKLLKEIKKEMK